MYLQTRFQIHAHRIRSSHQESPVIPRTRVSDFPGETFRVLKEKEIRQYGEYRTRRLVLQAWERI